MRIPFTTNIPTKKKKGRSRTVAKVIYAEPSNSKRYDKLPFRPSYKAKNNNNFKDIDLDMVAIREPISDKLMKRLDATLKNDQKTHDIYFGLIKKPSRSEYDFTLTKELKWAEYKLQEIAHILCHYKFGKGKELTERDIIRCYNRVENPFEGLEPEYLAKIEAQVNPILAARAKGKPLDQDLQTLSPNTFQWIKGSNMDWRYSGRPIYKNLIYETAITVIYGQSNVGKSFVVADIAGHIALGRDWSDFKYKPKDKVGIIRPIGVMYICAEPGKSFGKRLKALYKRLGTDDMPFYVIDDAPKFVKSDNDAKKIVNSIEEIENAEYIKIGMVVVDTLATTFEGGNENS